MPQDFGKEHPLFRHLTDGLLHCTSVASFRRICSVGRIEVNRGQFPSCGRYCCQELGGVSLFDFGNATDEQIFGVNSPEKWWPILGWHKPVSIIIKLDPDQMLGSLVRYPQVLEGTRGNVIPYVEVCHIGAVSLDAAKGFILLCATDYQNFRVVTEVAESELMEVVADFSVMVEQEQRRRDLEQAKLVNHLLRNSKPSSPD